MELKSALEKRLDRSGYLLCVVAGGTIKASAWTNPTLMGIAVLLALLSLTLQLVCLRVGFKSEERLLEQRAGRKVKALSWIVGTILILCRSAIFCVIGFVVTQLFI